MSNQLQKQIMKTQKNTVVALSFIFGILLSVQTTFAQSTEEDLLGDISDLFGDTSTSEDFGSEIPAPDESTGDDFLGGLEDLFEDITESEETSGDTETLDDQTATSDEQNYDLSGITPERLYGSAFEFPQNETDEYSLLKRVPGAIKHRGSTLLVISSKKTLSKYLPCKVAETAKITNALARLKMSQGAPLACREDVGARLYMPYRTFRGYR